MSLLAEGWTPWLALFGAAAGTYACRAIGVALSGRLVQDSEFFRWLSAVTYALVVALTIRMIFFPSGPLAQVPLWTRLLACAVGVGLKLGGSRGLTLPLLAGTSVILIYAAIAG
jgi:branched-subunit amino acid transport protein